MYGTGFKNINTYNTSINTWKYIGTYNVMLCQLIFWLDRILNIINFLFEIISFIIRFIGLSNGRITEILLYLNIWWPARR